MGLRPAEGAAAVKEIPVGAGEEGVGVFVGGEEVDKVSEHDERTVGAICLLYNPLHRLSN